MKVDVVRCILRFFWPETARGFFYWAGLFFVFLLLEFLWDGVSGSWLSKFGAAGFCIFFTLQGLSKIKEGKKRRSPGKL